MEHVHKAYIYKVIIKACTQSPLSCISNNTLFNEVSFGSGL